MQIRKQPGLRRKGVAPGRRRRLAALFALVSLNLAIWAVTRARERALEATPLAAADAPPGAAELTPPSSPDPGLLGVVLSGEAVVVEPKIEGRILRIFVKPGDRVSRGTPIAELERGLRRQELAGALAGLRDAARRFSRSSALSRGPSAVVPAEEVDAARARLAQERARVAALRVALAETTLRAPFDATVVERYLSPGALAGPGKPVARLATRGELRVRFAIPEEQATTVADGTPISVNIPSLALRARGRVVGVNPEIDAASRMIYAVATLEVQEGEGARLTTGLLARVRVFREVGPTLGSLELLPRR